MAGRDEAERILRASSGARYQTSLAAAGRRVAALTEGDRRRASASTAQYSGTDELYESQGAKRATMSTLGSHAGWPDLGYDEHDGTAPPTPIGHWVPARQRAGVVRGDAIAEDSYAHLHRAPPPSQRTVGTEPASVHGIARVESRVPPQQRARTPEPQSRPVQPPEQTVVRNMNGRYESMGPVAQTFDGGEYWGHMPQSPYANQRYSMPARGPRGWPDDAEPLVVDEPLPPLPSKAELHQYIRELVEAKQGLREHFRTGVLAGVKAHYGSR